VLFAVAELLVRHSDVLVQTMNILIVNQSVIDMCASFFTLLTAVVEVDGTRMSRDSSNDQFICRFWLTRAPLWSFLVTSTYSILLTALDRYVAVIHPIWYKVSTNRQWRFDNITLKGFLRFLDRVYAVAMGCLLT